MDWIQKDDSWGGAIEIGFFATYFNTQIIAVNIQTCKPEHFGTDL